MKCTKKSRGRMVSDTLRILYADSAVVIAEKPHNMASAPLSENDNENALTQILTQFPQGKLVVGKKACEHGLLHRLDTGTHGILVIALTQDAFDFLWEQQRQGAFIKEYAAFCTACKNSVFPDFTESFEKGAVISSYFRYFGKGRTQVLPVCITEKEAGKSAAAKKAEKGVYSTNIKNILPVNAGCSKTAACTELSPYDGIASNNAVLQVHCMLTKGFRHQIRAHLAWSGHPIVGDVLYNPECAGFDNAQKDAASTQQQELSVANTATQPDLQLYATAVEFIHPLTREKCRFCLSDFLTSATK